MASRNDEILKRVVEMLEDGKTFYREAREDGADLALGQLCTRMEEERDIAIRRILPYISDAEEAEAVAEEHGTWSGTADRLYAEARNVLGEGDHAFVKGLVDYEQRLAALVEAALADLEVGPAAEALVAIREDVLKTAETIAALRDTEERPRPA